MKSLLDRCIPCLTRHFRFHALSALLVLAGCAVRQPISVEQSAEATPYFDLTILHVNDMHSHFDPARLPEIPALPDTLFGGYPAIRAYAESVRAEQPNTLFLHAGDDFQGTGYFVLGHGRFNADLLNRIGIDVMVVGNHEFDELREMDIQLAEDGETVESIRPGSRIPRGKPLADFLDLIEFPMVAANMDVSDDPYLADKTNLVSWVILDVDGERVGVFGMVLENMPSISSPGTDITFVPEIDAARNAVSELEEQGVNKIIGISHIGYMNDKRVARAVDGIDVLIGGHSHDLLGDFSALGLPVVGAYPTVVTTPNGSQTLVIQAGAYARTVGRLDLTFDEAGEIVSWSGGNKLLALADTLPEDAVPEEAAHLIARVLEDADMREHINQTYKPGLDRIYGAPIAYVPKPLRNERVPTDSSGHGSQVAPLAAEALCWYMNEQGVPVDLSLINAGSIRTSIDSGPYYRNQTLLEVMIFANSVSTLPLTGAQLRNTLESVIMPGLINSDFDGRFPYTGRLAYTFDPTRPEGERFVSLQILDAEGNWTDLDDEQTYRVATSTYVAGGHDGYDLLREYIQENGGHEIHQAIIDNQTFTEYVMYRAAQDDGNLHPLPYTTVTIIQDPDKAPRSAY